MLAGPGRVQQVGQRVGVARDVGQHVAAGPAGQQRRRAGLLRGQPLGRGLQRPGRRVDAGQGDRRRPGGRARGQQRADPAQRLAQVVRADLGLRPGHGQPAQRRVLALRGGLVRMVRGQHEPQVTVLVRGLALARRDVDDDRVPQVRVRPRGQVRQPGLLRGLPERDGQRVGLARVAVPADLEPGLLALVPAEQHPAAGRVHDKRGRGGVQRPGPLPGAARRRRPARGAG